MCVWGEYTSLMNFWQKLRACLTHTLIKIWNISITLESSLPSALSKSNSIPFLQPAKSNHCFFYNHRLTVPIIKHTNEFNQWCWHFPPQHVLRFIHVASYISKFIPFNYGAEFHCMTVSQFVYSPVDGDWRFFQFGNYYE